MKTRLKELREQKGLTQTGLAQQIGCSQNLISRTELGSAAPAADILVACAHFFGVSIDYLLCETDYKYTADHYTSNRQPQTRFLDYYIKVQQLSDRQMKLVNDLVECLLEKEK